MNVYVIVGKSGSIFEPVYLSKREATRARHSMSLGKSAYVKTLIVANSSVEKFMSMTTESDKQTP